MKTENGPALTYELVYTLQKRTIHSIGPDGYYHKTGEARGVLVRSVSMGRAMYHMPEEMLEWKFKARLNGLEELCRIVDDGDTAVQVGRVGNEIHNLACKYQNDDELNGQLSSLAVRLWNLEKRLGQ